PRVAGASDRRLALLRVRAAGGPERRRHGASSRGSVPPGTEGRGVRATESSADVPESARPLARGAALGRATRADLVGLELERDVRVGGSARLAFAELHAEDGRDRRAAARSAAQANRG